MSVGRFDFVGGDDFRDSLESDYGELQKCLAAEAWKAVHVLAGSIVEALLIYYLSSIGYSKKDPLKLDLSEAISECESAGIISHKTAQLSNVIRSYRNLIHPGRMIRLGEPIDDSGALIAKSLVDIVIKEVAAKKARDYGYTAEQLLSKLKSDPNNHTVIKHLITEISPTEIERLILTVLPAEFGESFFDDNDWNLQNAVSLSYREGFHASTDAIREKASKRLVRVVKEGSGHQIANYELMFCTGEETDYLSPSERVLLINHLIAKLIARPTAPLARALQAASKWIPVDNPQSTVDHIARAIRTSAYAETDQELVRLAEIYYTHLSDESQRKQFVARLETWKDVFTRGGRKADAATLANLIESMSPVLDLEDLPF